MADSVELTSDWPPHKREWESFLFEIGEHPQWHSWFGGLSDREARRVWSEIEEKLFLQYRWFVRVWPEWCSSGIWKIPFPGSRFAGSNLDPEKHLGISLSLRERFQRWQDRFDEHEPWAPEKFDWVSFDEEELKLTQALKREVGDEMYVECHALEEMLMDGTTRDWRTILGVPDIPIQRESK